jgi:hypothetical protein
MNGPELTIVALAYAAALLLGQRVAAATVGGAQELGFAVAAVAGSLAAALLYYRRTDRRPPASVVFAAGAVQAVLAVALGMFTQLLWQPLTWPVVELPVIALLTLAFPFAVFPLARAFTGGGGSAALRGGAAGAITGTHVGITAAAAVAVAAGALLVPARGRSTVPLEPRQLPGLTISLPADWTAAEDNARQFEYGTIKLNQPDHDGRFLSVRWIDSDPVQADDYIKIVTAGGLVSRERDVAYVGGAGDSHEGTTFYLESPTDRATRAAATIWNCPKDHRVLWVFSFLAGRKSDLMATHHRIVQSIRCHTGVGKPAPSGATGAAAAAASADKVLPTFTAPVGFTRGKAAGGQLLYIGPNGQQIIFDSAVAGRSALTQAQVPPEVMAEMLKGLGLEKLDAPPTMRTVKDLLGHDRRVWSAAGTSSRRAPLQVELMVWYCDRRNMTFIGSYATPGKHEPREGVEALLPAVCHTE